MPRYSDEITTALKNVLRRRRDTGYRFIDEDILELSEMTGLDRDKILRWAQYIHDYYDTPASFTKYFENNVTVSDIHYYL